MYVFRHLTRGGLALAALLVTVALAAQTMVYSGADDGPGSLRQAIRDANDGELIFIDPALDDTELALSGGAIRIDKDLMVFGSPSRKLRVRGTERDRLFEITDGARVTLSGMAMSRGGSDKGGAVRVDNADVSLVDVDIEDSRATGDGGGGLYGMNAKVDLQRVRMKGNRADGPDGRGGAVRLDGGSRLTALDSDFEDNRARKSGGAIEDASVRPAGSRLDDVRFVRNNADKTLGAGGAVCVSGGADYAFRGGSLTGNYAAKGGAVYGKDSRLEFDDVAMADNIARNGGAVYSDRADVKVVGSDISGNQADGNGDLDGGGGLYNDGGRLLLTDGTLVKGNRAGGKRGSGGGVLNANGGTVDIDRADISRNDARKGGGGIEDRGGDDSRVSIDRSDIAFNRVIGVTDPADIEQFEGKGGGIEANEGSDISVKRTRLRGNSAATKGGGIYLGGDADVVVDESDIADNEAASSKDGDGGGGVYNDGGRLTLANLTRLSGNKASGEEGSGGALFDGLGATTIAEDVAFERNESEKSGGAIEERGGDDGELVLRRAKVLVNRTYGRDDADGGGIAVKGGSKALIEDSDFFDNLARRDGGGIYADASDVTVRRTNVAGNRADAKRRTDGGGGIYNRGGALTLRNSAVYRNRVTGAEGIGGGIYNADGQLDLRSTTIGENLSNYDFGGIANDGDADVINSTIANNKSARRGGGIGLGAGDYELRLRSSLVAKNLAAGQGSGNDVDRDRGNFKSGGYNLVGTDDGFVFTGGQDDQVGQDVQGIDPMIDDLVTEPGRRTPVYKLRCGSPARDKGDPSDLTGDQDDKPVFNGRRDIGASEADDVCANQPRRSPIAAQAGAGTQYGVFPNPVVGGERVNVRLYSGDVNVERSVALVNAAGQVVQEGRFAGEATFVPTGNLAPGSYRLLVTEGAEVSAFPVQVRQ